MKKILSFAVACSMCLCSTFSALAVGQAGDTTIADKDGNIYTLSQPILYTMTADDLKGKIFDFDSGYKLYGDYGFISDLGNRTIYAVPEEIEVYAPQNMFFDGVYGSLDLAKHNSSYYVISSFSIGGDFWPSLMLDDASSGGFFTALLALKSTSAEDTYEERTDLGDILVFYVTKEISNENPFASLPKIKDINFTDVAKGAYYEDSVIWAVTDNITSGTSENTFSPNETCTTAQILTLLWRQNGQPEPTIENPFSDVSDSDYFYKPALWAYEKGLVTGDKFNGNSPCKRINVVTYLAKLNDYRMGLLPIRKFDDIVKNSEDAKSVNWAVSNGVTSGTSYDKFNPNDTCTRGQIVTFMYRAFLSNLD